MSNTSQSERLPRTWNARLSRAVRHLGVPRTSVFLDLRVLLVLRVLPQAPTKLKLAVKPPIIGSMQHA